MDRREFLLTSGVLALSTLLTGCNSPNQSALRVKLLRNSIPPQLLNEFRRELQTKFQSHPNLDFSTETQLQALFNLLEKNKTAAGTPKPSSPIPLPIGSSQAQPAFDLISIGDYWLSSAIQQKLIQPLDPKKLPAWNQVPARWQALVTRNEQGIPTEGSAVWGAPYRWGSTVIAYRRQKFATAGWEPIQDWADLWRPELKGNISLLNQSREVIGLTLKKLGRSYNSPNLDAIPDLKSQLQQLHRQVKFYSSDAYLQPLLLEDTAVAVGWSTDLLLLSQRDRDIQIVFPQSGTALWADIWVRPTHSTAPSPEALVLSDRWIDFCWNPQIASQLTLLGNAASPIIIGQPPESLPLELRTQPVFMPDAQALKRSEFLLPLNPDTIRQYMTYWEAMRKTA